MTNKTLLVTLDTIKRGYSARGDQRVFGMSLGALISLGHHSLARRLETASDGVDFWDRDRDSLLAQQRAAAPADADPFLWEMDFDYPHSAKLREAETNLRTTYADVLAVIEVAESTVPLAEQADHDESKVVS